MDSGSDVLSVGVGRNHGEFGAHLDRVGTLHRRGGQLAEPPAPLLDLLRYQLGDQLVRRRIIRRFLAFVLVSDLGFDLRALVDLLDALSPDVGGNHGEFGAHLHRQRALRRRGGQLAEFSALVLDFGRSAIKPRKSTLQLPFIILLRMALDE